MNVVRDIAGFAFPFTAGIMAATFLGTAFSWASLHLPATASVILTSAAAAVLVHPSHRRLDGRMIYAIIILAALGCGFLTGFTHMLTSVGRLHGETSVPESITALGAGMKSLIDAIPFKDRSTNSIIAALITGDRTGIPREVTSAFRDSGASHILALSGLHLGIIYGIISRILCIAGNTPEAKAIRSLAIIAVCGIYTAATGAGPSITRAFLFILIGESASLTGRYRSTSTVLMASILIQLLFSPGSAGSIGFQLSYAAMAGIAFIYPWLKKLWPEGKGGMMRWIWNSAAMSTACQVTTGPLAYMYFGTFPQYFLLTNLLALPITGLIVPMGLLTTILNAAGICPGMLSYATEQLVAGLTFILQAIASL